MRDFLQLFIATIALPVAALLAACTSQTNVKTATPDPCHYYLQAGDTVVVFSPSALPSQQQVDATVAGLREWGYIPVCSHHVCDSVRTLDDCYDDVMWALRHPAAKALFCVRGGFGSSEVMERIPLDTLRRYPKLLIGYSDITAMHLAWNKAGLPTLHASMSAAFTSLPDTCLRYEQAMLRGEMPSYTFLPDTTNGSSPFGYNQEGEAEGILIGGNLSILKMSLCTDFCFLPSSEPYILLLEDVGGTWQNAFNDLSLLRHMGILSHAQAILYGDWVDMYSSLDDYSGTSRGGMFTSMEDLIHRQITTIDNGHDAPLTNVPTAYGLPFGHGHFNYPLRLGQKVHVSITKERTCITFL